MGSDVVPNKPAIWDYETQDIKMRECERMANEALNHRTEHAAEKMNKIVQTTENIDRVLLHPYFGLVLFLGVMSALFSSIFWLATPFMDWIDVLFTYINEIVAGMGPGTLWADFLANGVVSSFAAVLVFVPQIFILFLGIGFLEGSGYLARAATLIDRPFSALARASGEREGYAT